MYKAKVNEKEFNIEIDTNKEGTINGEPFKLDMLELEKERFHIIRNNKSYNAEVISFDADEKTFKIKVNGNQYQVAMKDKFDLLLQSMGMDSLNSKKVNELKAPMPGLVLDIRVNVGDQIKKGEPLIVLEAMKMENVLKAVADVTIKKIGVEKGQAVEKNQLLLQFE